MSFHHHSFQCSPVTLPPPAHVQTYHSIDSFAKTLFVGAVIKAYQTPTTDNAFLMTDAQKSWVELQRIVCLAHPVPQKKRPPG